MKAAKGRSPHDDYELPAELNFSKRRFIGFGVDAHERRAAKRLATYVVVSDQSLTISLSDGRTLSLPLAWYPRLQHGTPAERNNWRLVGDGVGIHWPELDEDLSVEGFLAGRKSIESVRSLKKWLADQVHVRRRNRKIA